MNHQTKDHPSGRAAPAYAWTRDLKGYTGNPPVVEWPNRSRIAVSFVLNVEEGAEQSVLAGDKTNESVYDIISDVAGVPNLHMLTNFSYGSRAGYWRIAEMLDRYNAICTVNACAQALEATPWIARDCMRRYLSELSGFYHPMSIYADSQQTIYVSDQAPRLTAISRDGATMSMCRPVLNWSHGICGDSRGNFYLSESRPNRVTRLTPVSQLEKPDAE